MRLSTASVDTVLARQCVAISLPAVFADTLQRVSFCSSVQGEITPASDIGDPHKLAIKTILNGEIVQVCPRDHAYPTRLNSTVLSL